MTGRSSPSAVASPPRTGCASPWPRTPRPSRPRAFCSPSSTSTRQAALRFASTWTGSTPAAASSRTPAVTSAFAVSQASCGCPSTTSPGGPTTQPRARARRVYGSRCTLASSISNLQSWKPFAPRWESSAASFQPRCCASQSRSSARPTATGRRGRTPFRARCATMRCSSARRSTIRPASRGRPGLAPTGFSAGSNSPCSSRRARESQASTLST
mmetsp:Transcript_33795/g.79524  ORF Transcript_33795/g.79524 Transcript_33795/m.79524 type:complete len:214 (-) Transcript_33795:604-1245(-)